MTHIPTAVSEMNRLMDVCGEQSAQIAALTADVARLRAALEWALPLALQATDTRRCERLQAGHHDICGTYKDGTTWVGIHQHEVDAIELARAALAARGQES